jgi:small basic protein
MIKKVALVLLVGVVVLVVAVLTVPALVGEFVSRAVHTVFHALDAVCRGFWSSVSDAYRERVALRRKLN